jgi:hypothetical protein
MKACTMIVVGTCALLLSAASFVMGADAASKSSRERTPFPSPGHARMNVLFLDDAAEGLPVGAAARYSHWPEWDARVPTFQKLLHAFIADFRKAQGQKAVSEASLYALEIPATTTAAKRTRLIAEYLSDIGKATGRATLVLARSTAGDDQLRLVYVLDGDCPPPQAAGFLAALAEITPPVFHGRIGERFGPFRAPPTVVFDPRANALAAVPADRKARQRWALLEEDAYLLPHYVLHAVAALHESPLTDEAAWVRNRALEPGSTLQQITSKLEQAHTLQAQGHTWQANHVANQAVNLASRLVASTGDINVFGAMSPRSLGQLRDQANRVGNDNSYGMAGLMVGMTRSTGDALTMGGIAAGASGVGAVPAGITAGAGFITRLAAETGQQASNRYIALQGRLNDHYSTLMAESQRNYAGASTMSPSRESAIIARVMASSAFYQDSRLNSPTQTLQQLESARTSTFAGTGARVVDPSVGGVLFQYDNQYFVDLSGQLRKDMADAVKSEQASGGLAMGKLSYFDDLPLLWLDVTAPRNGPLPVGIPRFIAATDLNVPHCFGGPWSFEPLTLAIRRNAEGRLLRATLRPAETQGPISYTLLNSVIKGAPPLLAVRNATGFEPALDTRKDGGFVWILRHGVTVDLNKDGLVEAINSPHGERVAYVRQARQLVGQQTSDGRRIDLQYSDYRPVAAALGSERHAGYAYRGDGKLVQVRGDRETWSIDYAPDGRPSKMTSGTTTIALAHDEKGRLSSVECGPTSVRIDYLQGTNTLHIAVPGKPAVDWLLGPISGPVMEDRAILLTRSIAGRILQVSKGSVLQAGNAKQFSPTETIALVP